MKVDYSLQRYVVKENFSRGNPIITSDTSTVSEKVGSKTKRRDIFSFSMTPQPEQSDGCEFHDIELVHNRSTDTAASKHVPNKQDPTIVVAFQGLKKVRRSEGGCLSL
jgi:hypothetical protein